MKANRFVLFLVVALLAVALAACERPATSAPTDVVPEATEGGDFPLPGETNEPLDQLAVIATQTAMAAQSGGVTEPTQAAPVDPTATTAAQPEPTQATVAQPTATTAPAAVATPSVPATYTLQKGEFPYCLARRFNVHPDDLLAANGLGRTGVTYEGQSLKIPTGVRAFPGTRALINHPGEYTVKAGDTIYTIACSYGDVDPLYLAQINGLSAPYTLTAGQKLNIP